MSGSKPSSATICANSLDAVPNSFHVKISRSSAMCVHVTGWAFGPSSPMIGPSQTDDVDRPDGNPVDRVGAAGLTYGVADRRHDGRCDRDARGLADTLRPEGRQRFGLLDEGRH